jgi:hypothetical protein
MARIFPLLVLISFVGFILANLPVNLIDGSKHHVFWDISPGFDLIFWASILTFTFNWIVFLKYHLTHIGLHCPA